MFGKPCKVCFEKEARIAELKEQIAYFKSILNPSPQARTYALLEEREQDDVLGGGGKEQIDVEAERIENEKIQSESDFIFSVNYERAEA